MPPTNTPGSGTVMHVEDVYTTDETGTPKDVFYKKEMIYWRVKIVDQSSAPVEGAAVTSEIVWPNEQIWFTDTQTTDGNGWAFFSKSTNPASLAGIHTINVTNVAKDGATYDPGANVKDSHQYTLQ